MARNSFPLYASNTTLGWSAVKRIGFDRAETLVALHKLRRVNDQFGNHIGYQLIDETQMFDKLLPSREGSSAALTAAESEANAGLCGKSVTATMTEKDRVTRVHPRERRALPAEDFIELAQAKVAAQTSSANLAKNKRGRHGDRAVRVYPKAVVWA